MLALARSYMGNDTTFNGVQILRHPAHNIVLSDGRSYFASGPWHHDRCGRRVKCFVFWSNVTLASHPPKVALASHNTLFYAYDSHSESRFNADAVEAHYNVTSLLGGPGDGFCFDTNSVHKGEMLGSEVRDVLIFEFDRASRRKHCAYAV